MALLDDLLGEKNLSKEDFDRARAKTEVSGRPFMPKNGVSNSRELKRILALPRRVWEERGDYLAELLTEHLRQPGGTQKLRPVQAAALQEAHDFGGAFSTARVGAGKCCGELSEIFDISRGERRQLKELCTRAVAVASMGSRGEIAARESVVFESGEKPCVRVTLADGSSVVLSTDHPVFTQYGWVEAAKIPIGTLTAVPRSMPEPLRYTAATDDEVILVAYILTDGGVSQRMATFTNGTAPVTAEFLEVAPRITGKAPTDKGPKYIEHLERDARCDQFDVLGLTPFRKKWGLFGLSKNKRIPASFWGLPQRQVALFLNRFWACDGYLMQDQKGYEIVLASERMIDDLKFLLLRLGIRGRKKYKPSRCTNCKDKTPKPAWRLSVTGDQVLRFAATVGPILAKEEACEALVVKFQGTKRNTNVDVVPVNRKTVPLIGAEMGWKKSPMYGGKGLQAHFLEELGATDGQWVGRETFARVCERFGYQGQYAWLGTGDIAWEKVTKVEPVGVLSVCDLTVPETGNFVCDGIVVHNTLISMLAFVVLEAKRPVLLVPAKLVEKTRRDMAQLRKHWLVPAYIRIMSYEILGREQGANFLLEANPDVLVMDECHRIRNSRAAVTRRVKHFLAENEKAVARGEATRTRVVAMSGTVTKRSMHDYAHITAWCLKRTNPVPEDFNTRMEWSLILDEKRNETEKLSPGALINLCNDEEREQYKIDPIVTIRRAYRRRLVETPGVVATQEGALGTSLSITSLTLIAPELATHFHTLKRKWERPDGEPILDALELWRHLRALAACGMFYRWNPAPPPEWLAQRKAWAKSVRVILQRGIPGLDSESPISTAMDKHAAQIIEMQKPPEARDTDIVEWKSPFTDEYLTPMQEELAKWRAIRPTFIPKTEAVWLSDVQLKAAAKWMQEEKGICWVEHIEFGRRLSELTGVPYYWRGGVNAEGKPIEDHPPGTPLIASIASNSEGRNLQAWSSMYVTSLPTTGAANEQMIGRCHRDGQEADEVSVVVPIMIKEQVVQFHGAIRDAQYISQTTGQEQKLCYADMDFVTVQEAPEGY